MRSLIIAMQAATIAGVMGLSLPLASAAPAGGSASSTNPETGVTTTSVANPDGTRTVTTTTSEDGVAGPSEPAAPDASAGDFASSTNPETGVTTTSVANPDGTHTVTTSSNGDEEPAGDGVSDDEEPTGDSDDEEPTGNLGDWVDDFEEWGDDDYDADRVAREGYGDSDDEEPTGNLGDWVDDFEEWDGDLEPNEGDDEDLEIDLSRIPSAFTEGETAADDAEDALYEDWDFDNLGGDDDELDSESYDPNWDAGDWDEDDSEDTETGDATSIFEASETGGDELLAMTGTNAVRNAVSVAVNVGIRNVTHGIPQMPIHVAPPRVETPRSYTITAGPTRYAPSGVALPR